MLRRVEGVRHIVCERREGCGEVKSDGTCVNEVNGTDNCPLDTDTRGLAQQVLGCRGLWAGFRTGMTRLPVEALASMINNLSDLPPSGPLVGI